MNKPVRAIANSSLEIMPQIARQGTKVEASALQLTSRAAGAKVEASASLAPVDEVHFSKEAKALMDAQSPPQKPSLRSRFYHEVKDTMADTVVLLAKVPLFAPLGHALYGFFTKPEHDDPPLHNVGNLSLTVMRGGQPNEQGLKQLKNQGVNTIVNLRVESEWEKTRAKQQGFKYVYLPLPALGRPTREEALKFLDIATNPANGKVYFHCLHGADRTGAVAAVYRIAVQGWPMEKAIAEMHKYNFHAGYQENKLDFFRDFANYWKKLDKVSQNKILHR